MTERPSPPPTLFPSLRQQILMKNAKREPTDLAAIREAGRIYRYHQLGAALAQRVDSHAWGVATLILHLWPDASRDLIVAAIHHDTGEHGPGDIPAQTKWALSEEARRELDALEDAALARAVGLLPELVPVDADRLRIADQLELMIHCYETMLDGDRRSAWGPFWRVASLLTRRPIEEPPGAADALLRWLLDAAEDLRPPRVPYL